MLNVLMLLMVMMMVIAMQTFLTIHPSSLARLTLANDTYHMPYHAMLHITCPIPCKIGQENGEQGCMHAAPSHDADEEGERRTGRERWEGTVCKGGVAAPCSHSRYPKSV